MNPIHSEITVRIDVTRASVVKLKMETKHSVNDVTKHVYVLFQHDAILFLSNLSQKKVLLDKKKHLNLRD